MAKGPQITDEVKALIYKLHEKHPKWTNTMIRNEVLGIVHEKDKSLPREWPSKYSIDRIMPEIRDQVRQNKLKPDPVDEPWSMTTMGEYYIPPETLPTVLALWGWMRETLDYHLTIREAQWAARLHVVADKIPIDEFSIYCRAYSATEMIYERIGAARKPWPHLDLTMLKYIFGTEMTPEHEAKILGKDQKVADELIFTLSEKEAKHAILSQIAGRQLGTNLEIFSMQETPTKAKYRRQKRDKGDTK